MELLYKNIWIVPVCPFVASMSVGLGLFFFPKATKSLRRICAIISIFLLGIAMFISFSIFWQQIRGNPNHQLLWSWFFNKDISLQIGFLIDPLTSTMLVSVTSVGILVMIYSDSYMSHDQGYVRFFAYLSLFTASMLGLVLSPNPVQIYIFWELVGMCSYLLIGFWFSRPSAANACQKAFITNRVGDFGLLLGILGTYWITGSFDIHSLSERFNDLIDSNGVNLFLANMCALLLFLGPAAKSAQFPLHVWLPDAMEGPTPISALIHAATMVAAGIFFVARMFHFFEALPFAMNTISWVGGITALLGATIALAQKDLKKGLAYSTMSQPGYMMLAPGIGSYRAALFHLITHAYSKALLFLGSGSVIHSMEPIVGYSPEKSQNMSFMGGLRKYMPITGTTFLLGTLSLCGIPPFACFWSKDEILVDSWIASASLGWIAWCTAGLTGFYMFRMYFVTFEGDFRGNLSYKDTDKSVSYKSIWGNLQTLSERDKVFSNNSYTSFSDPTGDFYEIPENVFSLPERRIKNKSLNIEKSFNVLSDFKGSDNRNEISEDAFVSINREIRNENILYPNESDNSMLFSLISLAIPTLFIGFIGVPFSHKGINSDLLSDLLAPLTDSFHKDNSENLVDFFLKSIPSVSIALVGVSISFFIYGPVSSRDLRKEIDPKTKDFLGYFFNSLSNWSYYRGYIDNLYNVIFIEGTRILSKSICFFDQWIIDGIVNGIGILSFFGGEGMRYGEGGRIPSYLFGLIIGNILMLIILIIKNDIIQSYEYFTMF
uniref:NAD(P)H-quinone oxidoreductase subunit 5, chloroplastic n=1 Tax=Angiopteris yunnanensis TaxID=2768835 RepID=A0A7G9UC30_9MONI|nr:NADH-plastoquinone oxidoreductase subunit 5 [Angiopteris yunnanensis]QNN90661.1 NADH-plastoquinone oxidoreductase subunit 5 [Angiopteris yunnanensis]